MNGSVLTGGISFCVDCPFYRSYTMNVFQNIIRGDKTQQGVCVSCCRCFRCITQTGVVLNIALQNSGKVYNYML